MNATSPAPVASELARSAMATFPPARRSPMMPEPTTVASNSAVPTPSATTLRASVGRSRAGCTRGARSRRSTAIRTPLRTCVLRTAASSPAQGTERGLVRPRLPRLAGLQRVEDLRVELRSGGRKLVEAPLPPPLVDDQPRPAKVRQVPRCGGLRHAEDRHEIAYAECALAQQMEDADARRVCQGP